MKRESRAPLLVALVLLLLPVLYVGSCLALVVPEGGTLQGKTPDGQIVTVNLGTRYRLKPSWAERVFWPLEQIDRKVRPEAWRWQITEAAAPANSAAPKHLQLTKEH